MVWRGGLPLLSIRRNSFLWYFISFLLVALCMFSLAVKPAHALALSTSVIAICLWLLALMGITFACVGDAQSAISSFLSSNSDALSFVDGLASQMQDGVLTLTVANVAGLRVFFGLAKLFFSAIVDLASGTVSVGSGGSLFTDLDGNSIDFMYASSGTDCSYGSFASYTDLNVTGLYTSPVNMDIGLSGAMSVVRPACEVTANYLYLGWAYGTDFTSFHAMESISIKNLSSGARIFNFGFVAFSNSSGTDYYLTPVATWEGRSTFGRVYEESSSDFGSLGTVTPYVSNFVVSSGTSDVGYSYDGVYSPGAVTGALGDLVGSLGDTGTLEVPCDVPLTDASSTDLTAPLSITQAIAVSLVAELDVAEVPGIPVAVIDFENWHDLDGDFWSDFDRYEIVPGDYNVNPFSGSIGWIVAQWNKSYARLGSWQTIVMFPLVLGLLLMFLGRGSSVLVGSLARQRKMSNVDLSKHSRINRDSGGEG